jgi:hypothetical protein
VGREWGLLAAVDATMSALAGLANGDLVPIMIAFAGTASGLAACFALPAIKDFSSAHLPVTA